MLDFYPNLNPDDPDSIKIKKLITKGLRFKSFKEFHINVLSNFTEFSGTLQFKDFMTFLTNYTQKSGLPIEKGFLKLFQSVFQQHYHALNFIKSYVNQMISQEERKLSMVKAQQSGANLKTT